MSDDIKSLLQMLRYWETEPCLPGPAKTCKEARELIEQQAARIAELEARIAAEPVAKLHRCDGGLVMEALEDAMNLPEGEHALYTTPIAIGPRYDWTVSGMKQSETGNWVMAGAAEKTGE